MPVFRSATKLVLIMLVAATIAALFVGKINSDQFFSVVMLVVGYYFGDKKHTSEEQQQ